MSHATRSTKEDVEIAGPERARGDGTLNIAVLLGQWKVCVMCNAHVVRYHLTENDYKQDAIVFEYIKTVMSVIDGGIFF